jgi:hypothetical protein
MKQYEDELKEKLAQFRAKESSVEEFGTLMGLRGNTIYGNIFVCLTTLMKF